MPTTRRQSLLLETAGKEEAKPQASPPKKPTPKKRGKKREVDEVEAEGLEDVEQKDDREKADDEEPDLKKQKQGSPEKEEAPAGEHASAKSPSGKLERQSGTIERGHVYFFYRPKVEHKEAHSIDDVSRFHMLLVPRPPEFSTYGQDETGTQQQDEDTEMKVLGEGADAVPAKETRDTAKKHYRLISIGKKQLPEPAHGGGHGGGRKDTFWATVTAVGDDLHSVEKGLGEKSYETKTRGTRHEAPSRLAGRGAYAIVNNEARVPSQRETHFGYHLSHPSEMGEIQEALGMHTASSFVLQVKNPLAPVTGGQRVGLSEDRRAKYPDWIMGDIFGKGGKRGRESYGLRFSSVEAIELLEYEGAELLFIAARSGEEGLETSLGEGRGEALREIETKESKETIEEVLRELALNADQFPTEPLEGHWI